MFGIDKVVLFDFDGVIVDTLEFSLALNRTINPLLTKETYQSFFDGNIYEVEDSHSDTYTWIGDDQWYPLYSKHIMETPPVSGMEKFIEDLSRSFPLAIVSSTISAPIDDYLRKYDLATSFSRTMGGDVHKSKVEKFKMLFEYFGEGVTYIFITDTLGDIREAAQVAIPAIGVTWGFHPRARLEKGNPLVIVDTPKELYEKVSEFFSFQNAGV